MAEAAQVRATFAELYFERIEKGGAVAVSTYLASEHDNRSDQKAWFLAGYNEMLRRIEPEKILCYNTIIDRISTRLLHRIPRSRIDS